MGDKIYINNNSANTNTLFSDYDNLSFNKPNTTYIQSAPIYSNLNSNYSHSTNRSPLTLNSVFNGIESASDTALDFAAWLGEMADKHGISNAPSPVHIDALGIGEELFLKNGKGALSRFGSAVNAVTGAADTLSTFNKDYKAGGKDYSSTMGAILNSTAKTALTSETGIWAGGIASTTIAGALAAAGATGAATLALPVIGGAVIGVTAAYGASIAYDYGKDALSSLAGTVSGWFD